MKNKILLSTIAALLVLMLSACQGTDVIANYGIKSFDEVAVIMSESISKDDNGYTIHSPNNMESFSFGEKLNLKFDITPFINAGLDATKLGGNIVVQDDAFIIISEGNSVNETSVSSAFEKLIRSNRDALEYHTDHDIYEFMLGNGNAFRWAKNINTNERDVVFVLNPAPFIDAGLNPESLEGWKFARVKIMENAKTIEVDKLLKVYNIK